MMQVVGWKPLYYRVYFKSDIMPGMERKMNFQQQVSTSAQAAAATCAFFDPVQA